MNVFIHIYIYHVWCFKLEVKLDNWMTMIKRNMDASMIRWMSQQVVVEDDWDDNKKHFVLSTVFFLNIWVVIKRIIERILSENGSGDRRSESSRVFIKYCGFFLKIFKYPDPCLSLFSLGFSVCTHTRQVEEHQRCSRTGRVQNNSNIWEKNHNI